MPLCSIKNKTMNNGTYTFEVCANSVASCLAAQEGGAQRVELCAGIPEGGTTPSYGEITMARRLLDIRLHVIIRPRGGDFLYSPIEVETMLEDIRMARQAGADGLVFGCLRENGDIDIETTKRLMDAGKPAETLLSPSIVPSIIARILTGHLMNWYHWE